MDNQEYQQVIGRVEALDARITSAASRRNALLNEADKLKEEIDADVKELHGLRNHYGLTA